ncbi:uncharacterized protein VP01_9219g1, partial [Puccinia sorghi]
SCKIAKSERHHHHLPESIPRNHPLDLFVTDVLGPLEADPFGHQFLLMARNHASTFSFVFPMKTHAEVPDLLIDLIKKIHCTCLKLANFAKS